MSTQSTPSEQSSLLWRCGRTSSRSTIWTTRAVVTGAAVVTGDARVTDTDWVDE